VDEFDLAVIHARNLTKRFGGHVAVDAIDLDVESGEFFGVLGPNGAGKSTTMRMLSCISFPTSGLLRVLGADPRKDETRIRSRLGVVPQANTLDRDLTVRENVVTYARYFGIGRARARELAMDMLASFQLEDRSDSRVEALSGGMQRRLAIARALVSEPEVMFLDEPTTGLDPQARQLLWERLRRLKQNGTTVVLTTHYMDEAEQLCDRLVVMDHGRIVAEGTPQALLKEHAGGAEVLELRFGNQEPHEFAAELDGLGERLDELSDRILVYAADGEQAAAEVQRRGMTPTGILIRRASLEDVFLHLTGRTLVE
jgi:lipooligosaccharide transport system ATP-binding protein